MPEQSSPQGGASYVPYQAYKPKRHSRTLSNNHNLTSNGSPNSVSRPSSIVGFPPTSPQRTLGEREPPIDSNCRQQQLPTSPNILGPAVTAINASSNELPSPISNNSHDTSTILNSTSSAIFTSNSRLSDPPEEVYKVSTNDYMESRPTRSTSVTPNSISSSSAVETDALHREKSPSGRKVSTFRKVPARNARPSVPSSPLGSKAPLTPSSNNTFNANSIIVGAANLQKPNGTIVLPSSNPTVQQSQPLENKSNVAVRQNYQRTKVESITPQPVARSKSSSSQIKDTGSSGIIHDIPTSSLQPRTQAPYQAGSQPKGVCGSLTDEFMALRRIKRDGIGDGAGMTRVEKTKLERRLEKLINLHFPLTSASPVDSKATTGNEKRLSGHVNVKDMRRTSSFFDWNNVRNLSFNDAGELWRGVITNALSDKQKMEIRAAEQRIAPWQEDDSVSQCPLCMTSFHPLTNRKHHCRLCGQIICSLPPKRPQRPEMCSILFVVDSKTRQIEEVGEGVDYGVRKRKNSRVTPNQPKQEEEEEKFLKAVRICRKCHPILLLQQHQQEIAHTPLFVNLHEAFISLERDIEDSLSQFQILLLGLSHDNQSTKEASATRKRLVDSFARYDALAKRIQSLPCPNGAGSSQDRVQIAISKRANLFLQEHMFPLQSLPTSKLNIGGTGSTPSSNKVSNGTYIDPDSELANKLQPLLEQEALLETFVEEAKAHRKFEDMKTLKMNLKEIRKEIELLLSGVGTSIGTQPKA